MISQSNGANNQNQILKNKESPMLTFSTITQHQEEKLFKSENKSKFNFKPLKTDKLNKSEMYSNWKKEDWNLI